MPEELRNIKLQGEFGDIQDMMQRLLHEISTKGRDGADLKRTFGIDVQQVKRAISREAPSVPAIRNILDRLGVKVRVTFDLPGEVIYHESRATAGAAIHTAFVHKPFPWAEIYDVEIDGRLAALDFTDQEKAIAWAQEHLAMRLRPRQIEEDDDDE